MRASKHWLHQRISAIILCFFVPGFWLLAKALNTSSYKQLHTTLSTPTILTFLSITFLFILYHAQLGLTVIIEDYTQATKRKIVIYLTNAVLLALLLSFIYSILKLLKGI